jgi:hypothetical protein
MAASFTVEEKMLNRVAALLLVGFGGASVAFALQNVPIAFADNGLVCKEQSDSELVCGATCGTDWYDWYSRESSGYWEVTISSEEHCQGCCDAESCVAETAIDFSDTCWCHGDICD